MMPKARLVNLQPSDDMPQLDDEQPWLNVEASNDVRFSARAQLGSQIVAAFSISRVSRIMGRCKRRWLRPFMGCQIQCADDLGLDYTLGPLSTNPSRSGLVGASLMQTSRKRPIADIHILPHTKAWLTPVHLPPTGSAFRV